MIVNHLKMLLINSIFHKFYTKKYENFYYFTHIQIIFKSL